MRDVLTERKQAVQLSGQLGDWRPITIKFTGEVLPRERAEPFKGAMFAACPGDLVFSKIDARNGAVGLIPHSLSKVVLTPEYPVMMPDLAKLRPAYLNYLLRAEHFRIDLQRRASGTSGRKRVTPEAFLGLSVPLPSLNEQDALVAGYAEALTRAKQKEKDAGDISATSHRAFEAALGVASPPPLPNRPTFIAWFKDIDRWSHEGVLRAVSKPQRAQTKWPVLALADLVDDIENGWSPQCLDRPAGPEDWGVLKVGAVSFGRFDESENKQLPAKLQPQP
ncbi:MAG: hypothetical protein H0W40_16040 [Methylibium sp.]|uniref:hypothetical protein n=1 Tax=Methylibium sp. TaxID=2067992 RepID=UPI00183F9096|nr:hypothetical protein [Methylibium sp.]MBA3598867.1 hypothetical protein [Methylibium sp.]